MNLNLEKAVSSVASVEYGGTYTTGTLAESMVVPGGSRVRAVGGAVEAGQSILVPENFNFLVRATKQERVGHGLVHTHHLVGGAGLI